MWVLTGLYIGNGNDLRITSNISPLQNIVLDPKNLEALLQELQCHVPNNLLLFPDTCKKNETSEEFRDLIGSIPTEKGWVANHLHQYQGFWHTSRQLQGVLACQKHYQAHDGDIFLVTTPKSGSTWLKALMFALVNRVSFPDPKQHPLLTDNPHALVPFLEMEYIGKEHLDFTNFTFPRLFSTHLPLVSLPKSVEDSGCKLVYLCRNPKDTFVSLWHFTNKLRPADRGAGSLEETFDKFCRGVSLYGPFWDHVLGYWKGSLEWPQRIFFLKYEDMKNEPKIQLRRLSEFMGCPFSLEEERSGVLDGILELCSFENLSNLEVNKIGRLPSGEEHRAFFRRGEVGDSKKYLTAEMKEKNGHDHRAEVALLWFKAVVRSEGGRRTVFLYWLSAAC